LTLVKRKAEDFAPQKCSSLRKNGFVLLGSGDPKEQHPCKIVDMSTSKTGKHGGAKVHLVGIDIFTEKKYEQIAGSTDNVNVPVISRSDYQLVDIDEDDTIQVLDSNGDMRSEFRLPNFCESDTTMAQAIREAFDDGKEVTVTITSSMGTDAIKAYKIGK